MEKEEARMCCRSDYRKEFERGRKGKTGSRFSLQLLHWESYLMPQLPTVTHLFARRWCLLVFAGVSPGVFCLTLLSGCYQACWAPVLGL